jgi:GT2 family glycosyltransferase/SAM-dependent methyltransferase
MDPLDSPMKTRLELPWTGERLVPYHFGDTAVEHLHRYAFALEYVGGKEVLDIACGEGYGTYLLSDVAANVIGVDISADVIAHAIGKYGNRISFRQGSCIDIPLNNSSVDAVVSFETLEHIAEHELMLREVKRVLRTDGILIISTPDKLFCSDLPKNNNPFHVKELYREAFICLMESYFKRVLIFNQKICHTSVLAPTAGAPLTGFRHYLGDFRSVRHGGEIMGPLFNLAVATDCELSLPSNVSLFQGLDIPTEVEKQLVESRAAQATLIGELADSRAALTKTRKDLENLQCQFDKLQRPPAGDKTLALGIVTYNNSAVQLARLTRSIELSAARFCDGKRDVRVYSIDCGYPAEWVSTAIQQYCLAPGGNLGFGRAMNLLMAKAFDTHGVSSFLCVNPDGVLHIDLLREMQSYADQYPDSVIEARQFPEEHPKPYDPDTGVTTWASGACMLIPRRIYEAIGGFDENFFMYMEDVDFSWRARTAGFTVRVAPRALFAHSVLDRVVDATAEKHYYLSARYLAYKWQKPQEQGLFERTLLEREYLSVLPPLPSLGNSKPTQNDVAVFEHGFTYAPLRWS